MSSNSVIGLYLVFFFSLFSSLYFYVSVDYMHYCIDELLRILIIVFIIIWSQYKCSKNQIFNHSIFILNKDMIKVISSKSSHKKWIYLVKSVQNRKILYFMVGLFLHYLLSSFNHQRQIIIYFLINRIYIENFGLFYGWIQCSNQIV